MASKRVTMSDADTLRDAAAKLRKLAEDATPGPWAVAWTLVVQPATGATVAQTSTSPNIPYIAAMNPLVGAALAEVLAAEARDADLGLGYHDALLDVARAVLGEMGGSDE